MNEQREPHTHTYSISWITSSVQQPLSSHQSTFCSYYRPPCGSKHPAIGCTCLSFFCYSFFTSVPVLFPVLCRVVSVSLYVHDSFFKEVHKYCIRSLELDPLWIKLQDVTNDAPECIVVLRRIPMGGRVTLSERSEQNPPVDFIMLFYLF